jgi:hypothetical protein
MRRFPSPICARLNISHGNQSCGAINQKYHDQRNHDSRKHNPTDTEKAVVSPTARLIPLTAGRNVASVLMACHLTSTQDTERYNALRSGQFPFNPTNPRLSPFCCVTGVWAPWLRAPSWRPTTQSSNRSPSPSRERNLRCRDGRAKAVLSPGRDQSRGAGSAKAPIPEEKA